MSRLIAFEGIDGTGKSTQIRLLSSKLTELGIKHLALKEPSDDGLGGRVRDLLLNRPIPFDSSADIYLFLAARADAVSQIYLPKLREGYIILLDRFIDSTIAYQSKSVEDMVDLYKLCMRATRNLKPDLTVLFDADVETASHRIQVRGQDHYDLQSLETKKRIRNNYHIWLNMHAPYPHKILNATASIEDIHSSVMAIMDDIGVI